jgi:hypothetical protein
VLKTVKEFCSPEERFSGGLIEDQGVKFAPMKAASFPLRGALILVLLIPGIALAQPRSAQEKARALAALHAADDYEASVEAVLAHIDDDDFVDREKASPHKTKLHQARLARDRVSDKDWNADIDVLLDSAVGLWTDAIPKPIRKGDDILPAALARWHSDRDLVATEINTGQRGLLLEAIRKRVHKQSN